MKCVVMTKIHPKASENITRNVISRYKKKVKTEDGNFRYEYSERQVQLRNNKKAERLEKLSSSISNLKKKINSDLSAKDEKTRSLALAVGLMNHTFARVGNSESASEGHYGVTGWKIDHVTFSGKSATISYVGKSGVDQKKSITESKLVSALKKVCKDKKKGDSIFSCKNFSVTAEDVNKYLSDFDITAKDIRGFHANKEMQKTLRKVRSEGKSLPKDKKEKEKLLKDEFKKALEIVSKSVGHLSSTLRTQYLVPGLEDAYIKDGTVMKEMKKKSSESILEEIKSFGPALELYREASINEISGTQTNLNRNIFQYINNRGRGVVFFNLVDPVVSVSSVHGEKLLVQVRDSPKVIFGS